MPPWSVHCSTGSRARSAPSWLTVSTMASGMADTAPTRRDHHIQMITERGRLGWQRAVHYGRRSLGEVAAGCTVMNIMTSLGMPLTRKIA